MSRTASALLLLALLSACGGGGGGSQTSGPDGSWLTFTPARVDVAAYQGEPAAFSIVARSARTFTQAVNVLVLDAGGGIDPVVAVTANSDTQYTASLRTASGLGPGAHKGALEVRVCFDDPRTCRQPLEGSPWSVPYTFNVKGPDLRPLQPILGMRAWSTSGGNEEHFATVPASFRPADFTRRWWTVVEPRAGVFPAPLVADGGRVFLLTKPQAWPTTSHTLLRAYAEEDGSLRWTVDLGFNSQGGIGASDPAVGDGRVYVVVGQAIRAYDQATGSLLWSSALPADLTLYASAPVPHGDGVFLGGTGAQQGRFIVKVKAADGTVAWTQPTGTGSAFAPVPILRGGLLFTGGASAISALNATDGSTAWSVPVVADQDLPGFLALTGGLVCRRDGTACVDLTTRAVSAYTGAAGQLILGGAGGVVYEAPRYSGATLQVRDEASGAALWSWQGPTVTTAWWAIPTDGQVFVPGRVVDAATHATLPAAAPACASAISASGVGYCVTDDTFGLRLQAVNLR
jgi:outer membrane protein assembly factor BamB